MSQSRFGGRRMKITPRHLYNVHKLHVLRVFTQPYPATPLGVDITSYTTPAIAERQADFASIHRAIPPVESELLPCTCTSNSWPVGSPHRLSGADKWMRSRLPCAELTVLRHCLSIILTMLNATLHHIWTNVHPPKDMKHDFRGRRSFWSHVLKLVRCNLASPELLV
ncbi:hypothetical protein CI102_2690 [Trichoderma harzianum]|nr:hypothetical protein CI102_2690 [Trichoderma harzianum]